MITGGVGGARDRRQLDGSSCDGCDICYESCNGDCDDACDCNGFLGWGGCNSCDDGCDTSCDTGCDGGCDSSCNSCSGAACNTGMYGTPSECNRSPATAVGSAGCSTCTNKPANSAYTGVSTTSTCPYVCSADFYRSGTSCLPCSSCSGASSYQVSDCQAGGETNNRVCATRSLCIVQPTVCDGSYSGTMLHVSENNLGGSLPTQLATLTALTSIQLHKNSLSGSLPTQLGSLTALTSMVLGWNSLSGSLPTQLGALTVLTWMHLTANGLSGSLPTQLGALTVLDEM